MEKFLIDRFSTRTLYFFSNFAYTVCIGLIYFFDNKNYIPVIIALFSTSGILLTAITTLPYQIVSEYHQDKAYRSKSASGSKRGLGVDCSLLSCMFFASQALVSTFISLLTANLGKSAILLAGSLFGFVCCFCAATVVIYPEANAKTKNASSKKIENDKASSQV